ncbi:MAG: response regulator [Gorillibacterium sp.]|nr:response regulator [Gorillibacterium sp.]
MYKLILIDDEENVREGVRREIDWLALGFEVIGVAENGKEATEMIERHVPDVVVTDIKMPFMDGLELSAWIKDRYPAVRIVILTGFDEFEYAQKAVKLLIDEYVLKPFTSNELVQALIKVKERLIHESARREDMQVLQEHYRKSLPVLKENFLISLVTRQLSRRDIEDKSALYELPLAGNGFVASVISVDSPRAEATFQGDGLLSTTPLSSGSLKDSADKELQLFAVLNITEEIAAEYKLGIPFIHNDRVVLLTVTHEPDQEVLTDTTLPILNKIRQSVERYLKLTVTIGVGTVRGSVTDFKYSYEDAVLALDYRLLHGSNRVIWINDVEKRMVERVRFDEFNQQSLIRSLKVGTLTEIKETVESMFHAIAEAAVSFADYQIYLVEMLTAILKVCKDADLDTDHVFGENFLLFAELHRFSSLQETQNWITALCTKIHSSIVSDRQFSYKNLVNEAKAYTHAHYHENDISINMICSHLHISSGYFSTIFKKETKTTFVNYLMQLRMDVAKDLLQSTDLKAFEIADKVGFVDPNYFSFCFKKVCGISPKEYRSSVSGDRS